MADQEVVKHTKKVYNVIKDKEHNGWHKVKEIVMEIFIIVFAVSLSIWFHNRSEHAHQQKAAKEFLLGLKEDLQKDTREIAADIQSYKMQEATFGYITHIKMNEALNTDSIGFYSGGLFNTTLLNPNNGRFEGFKASGKIGTIENATLQNDIMDLYQENIPALMLSTNMYVSHKSKLLDYIQRNNKRITDSTSNLATILASDEAQNLSTPLSDTREIIERYGECVNKMNKIIGEINKQYED